jgi:hypothetical protein
MQRRLVQVAETWESGNKYRGGHTLRKSDVAMGNLARNGRFNGDKLMNIIYV